MRKSDELTSPESCMSRGLRDEMTFVLLARDIAAPEAIRSWARSRIEMGRNTPDDPQMVEALFCAQEMHLTRDDIRRRLADGEQPSKDSRDAVIDRQAEEIRGLREALYSIVSKAEECFSHDTPGIELESVKDHDMGRRLAYSVAARIARAALNPTPKEHLNA